jgi:SAM-dependent methyltransferase
MKYRDSNDNYDTYVSKQNFVSKYKGQHSLRFDYESVFSELNTDSYLLDVGCRDARFVKHLQKRFKNSYGMDIGEGGYNLSVNLHTKEWTQKYIKLEDVQKNIPFDHTFDFINFSHTLEHCYKPDTAMENVLNKLKDGGYLFIAIPSDLPDSGGLLNKLEKGSDYHMVFWESDEDVRKYFAKFNLELLSIKHNYKYGNQTKKIGEWQVFLKKN